MHCVPTKHTWQGKPVWPHVNTCFFYIFVRFQVPLQTGTEPDSDTEEHLGTLGSIWGATERGADRSSRSKSPPRPLTLTWVTLQVLTASSMDPTGIAAHVRFRFAVRRHSGLETWAGHRTDTPCLAKSREISLRDLNCEVREGESRRWIQIRSPNFAQHSKQHAGRQRQRYRLSFGQGINRLSS